MAYNRGNNPDLVLTAIDSVFYGEYDYPEIPGVATAENELLFKQSQADRGAVITEEYQGPGEWIETQEEQNLPEAAIRTGNKKTHTVANFKKSLKIPVEFYEDDIHDSVDATIKKMAIRAKTTRDKRAFINYRDGNTSSVLSSDGANLFSNSHTSMLGETIDNLETGTLTPSNFEILMRVLIEQKAQDGELGGHAPAAFLVPPALFPDAIEITKSDLQPGTSNNNVNYVSLIYPGMQVFQTPYIGAAYGGSNVEHFLVGRNHSIFRWVRIPMETDLIDWRYDGQDRYTYKGRYREVTSPISWEGAVMSDGSV